MFPKPQAMRQPDGRSRYAFVTFLMLNDSYLPGVLLLAHGLRRQKTQADLICMVTEEISRPARQALAQLYDAVIDVEKIFVPHSRVGKRPYLPYVFTRLHALRLGADGDLGHSYDKIALLDADLLPLRHYDHLFTLPAPAGTINERKTNVMEWGEDGNFIIPDSVAQDGTWHWHQLYADCPHGQPIPREITDRVASDPSNMGVISSLLVLEPSLAEFNAILADIQTPTVQPLVGNTFDWPEMQYLTLRYSGQWTNVDLRFHSLNGYPNLDVLYGIHYTGFKPWQFRREGSMDRYGRRDDFQLWFSLYREMLQKHPLLQSNRKLRSLLQQIHTFTGVTATPPKRKPEKKRPSTTPLPKQAARPRKKGPKSGKSRRNGRG
jgi:alpha-N-acetylglucosamine transferase